MHRNFDAASAASGYVVDTPYPETFFRELSPTWLNYVAATRGAAARDLDQPFTYLELGCGLGHSAITNAGAFPQGRFHACDFNRAYVEHARGRASAFGIHNVEFHACSFGELCRGTLPMFDFIAAHGVYSWVAPQERQAIRHLVRDRLKPAGLLYLSYNSLPGWAGELPLRKLLVELAAGEGSSTTARTARALRSLQSLGSQRLKFLEANPASSAAIGAYVSAPISYVAHEFLNQTWEPFYCIDVAEQLQEAKVEYLGSATLVDNHPLLRVDESTFRSIGRLATERQRRLALDFATNQQFRRDVFWRAPCRYVGESALDAVMVGCSGDPGELRAEVKVPRGVIHFRETFVRRLRPLLTGGPVTIGAAVAGLGGSTQEAEESRRNLLYLVAAGALMPFARARASVVAAPACQAANAIVEQILRYSVGHDVACVLPSEILGNGVRISPAEATAVVEWLTGDRAVAPARAALVGRLLRVGILR